MGAERRGERGERGLAWAGDVIKSDDLSPRTSTELQNHQMSFVSMCLRLCVCVCVSVHTCVCVCLCLMLMRLFALQVVVYMTRCLYVKVCA